MQNPPKALEARSAQEGLVLSEAQLAGLEKAQADNEARRGVSRLPRRAGSFYAGTLKGGGRIYQQTFLDTFSPPPPSGLFNARDASLRANA